MPHHAIRHREPTDDERRAMEKRARSLLASLRDEPILGCLMMIPLALGAGLGQALFWLGGQFSSTLATAGLLVGVACGVLLLVPPLRGMARDRRRARADLEERRVQEIEVRDARWARTPDGRVAVAEIGRDRLLVFRAWSLRNPKVYGLDHAMPRVKTDGSPSFSNHLPAPHTFPSPDFRLHRTPRSGGILLIEVRGDPCAPERDLTRVLTDFLDDSALIRGSLHDAEAAFEAWEVIENP